MCKFSFAGFLSLLLLGSATLTGCADGGPEIVDTGAATEKAETSSESGSEKPKADETAGDVVDAATPSSAAPAMELTEPEEAAGPSLVIGNAAPAISISKWINGEAFTAYTPDKVHVVEFWATWCGPCLASMPHIASLQKDYGDKVTFVGVTAEDADTVTGFMDQTSGTGDKKWSEVLTYRIALDDEGKTNASFMEAAGQNGIPCAFIIGKTGLIEWIGHPMEIDEPLKQIVEGSWDSEKAKLVAKEATEVRDALNEIGPQVDEAVSSGDFPKAVALVDGLIARFPTNTDLPMIRFQCLIGGGMSEPANETAKALIEKAGDDGRQLDQLAWMMATAPEAKGIDFDIALSAAQKAVTLSEEKDVSAIETLARVHFRKGNVAEAVALQKKCLELAANPRQVQQLQAGLEKYEAAAPKEEAAAPAVPETPAEPTPAEPAAATPQAPAEPEAAAPEAKPETPAAEPEAK